MEAVTAPSANFRFVMLPSGGSRLMSGASLACVILPSGTVRACTAKGTLPNCTVAHLTVRTYGDAQEEIVVARNDVLRNRRQTAQHDVEQPIAHLDAVGAGPLFGP